MRTDDHQPGTASTRDPDAIRPAVSVWVVTRQSGLTDVGRGDDVHHKFSRVPVVSLENPT